MEDMVKNELVFYSKLAKPMVLNLPESRDRTLAVAWIKKLSDESVGDERLRTSYMKLLLFCLQRRRLSGIFADDPLLCEALEDLASNVDLNEFARNLLKQERLDRREMIRQETKGDIAAFPPLTTDCSPDLTEYVSVQDIPNFGVHAYYAISKEPINKWQRPELAIFPKGTKSAVDTSIAASTAPMTPKGSASAPEVEEGAGAPAPTEPPPQEKRKRRARKRGSSPPTRPIGQVKGATVERLTPTWGTNLVHIRGRTDIGRIKDSPEVDKAFEAKVSQIIEDEEAEGERKERAVSRRAEEMTYAESEFRHGTTDKAKIPSRFAQLGGRSSLRDPKNQKGPRTNVNGTKKKDKSLNILGPRPANLPEEFDDSTKNVLKEIGLTWRDLMSQDIAEELQQIGDEVLVEDNGEEFQIDDLQLEGCEEIDCDAFCREAEADLVARGALYDEGVAEDEKLIEWLQDRIEEVEQQQDIFREAEEMRRVSPAISRGIPITTPQSLARPKRVKSPEKTYAEATDHFLSDRRQISTDRKPKRSKEPTGEARALSKVIEKTQKAARVASRRHSTRDDSDEFARPEREFQEEKLNENRRNRTARPSPGSYGMCPANCKKAEDTDEVALRTNEKTVVNQRGVEALNAVRRNLFGSRREAMEVPEATGAKSRDLHDLRHWEQEPALMQERQQDQTGPFGAPEDCMVPQQEEGGICDPDFRQFPHKTPQMYIEEVVRRHRQSPQMRAPSPLRMEAHSPSDSCMSPGSPEELDKFRRSQREMEQLIQLLSDLEAQIEKTRRAAWRDIKEIVMELHPTPTDEGNEAESVDGELHGPLPPQNMHSTGISSGGRYSPGCVGPWEPCEIEADHEYLTQAMQRAQGTMLADSHMYECLGEYQLPESLSPQITRACGMSHREVDEVMFHIEDDQSVDTEVGNERKRRALKGSGGAQAGLPARL